MAFPFTSLRQNSQTIAISASFNSHTVIGALGSAYSKLDSALFFYFPYSTYSFTSLITLYIFNWTGLFLFAEFFTYLIYRQVGNGLQLFIHLDLATFPVAIFPYIYLFISDVTSQYILLILQIWTLLLVSTALCFGKGIRLDKAIVVSLTTMYLNIALLFVQRRFA